MTKEAFIKLILTVESVYDPYTKAYYEKFEADNDWIHCLKRNTASWDILYIKDLYNAYLEKEIIDKLTMESYMPKGLASMACELLKAAGIYDKKGYR
jgi:hypothetical protein